MSDRFEQERQRLIQIAMNNPRPCMVCDFHEVVGIGTWIPDKRYRLAAGGSNDKTPVFAFWLCRNHTVTSPENDKLIRQAVIRSIR